MNKLHSLIVAVVLVVPALGFAQKTGGRTDGPEGLEIGHGGYTRLGGGNFSLQLDFGAGFPSASNAPLLFGGTVSFWLDDWFVADATVQHVVNTKTVIQVGPRFRTATYPVAAFIGLKAGPTIYPGSVNFTLSPQVGADILLAEHILMGVNYNLDLDFVTGGPRVSHRVFMSLGYRF